MSAPPQERVLPLPKVWGRKRARAIGPPEVLKVLSSCDEEAMARLRANDGSGLDILFQRYSRLIFRIAIRILHDHGEAEEVVQEVFFSVFQKAKLYDPAKGTAKAWIIKIASHRALDRKSYLDRRGFGRGTEVGCLDDTLLDETSLETHPESPMATALSRFGGPKGRIEE